jgi:hypothetical protein
MNYVRGNFARGENRAEQASPGERTKKIEHHCDKQVFDFCAHRR